MRCVGVAGRLNVISQASVAPFAIAVTSAVKVPRADATSPVGVGTSCAVLIAVA